MFVLRYAFNWLNDIACKVQFALKHIIRMLDEQEPRENFYVTEDETNLIINRL